MPMTKKTQQIIDEKFSLLEKRIHDLEIISIFLLEHIEEVIKRNKAYAEMREYQQKNNEADKVYVLNSVRKKYVAKKLLDDLLENIKNKK
jgi:hypothetical protein